MQGLDLDTYVKYMGGDMAAFKESFREQSERQVKVRLALEKVAELENIVPTEDDIAAELEKLSKMYNMEVEQVKAAIPDGELAKDIAVTKAIDFIRANAEITEVDALSEKKPAAKKTTTKKATTKKTDAEVASEPAEKKPAAKKTTSTAKKTTSSTAAKKTTSTAKKTTSTAAKKTTTTAKKTATTAKKTEDK